LNNIKNKFSKIVDVDSEREKILKEIEYLKTEREKLENEFKEKKGTLIAKYIEANKKYAHLQKEINFLEESLALVQFNLMAS